MVEGENENPIVTIILTAGRLINSLKTSRKGCFFSAASDFSFSLLAGCRFTANQINPAMRTKME